MRLSLIDLTAKFATRADCVAFLEHLRWGDTVTSPYVPTAKVYVLKDGWYKCAATGRRFNFATGTILFATKLPLQKWIVAAYLLVSSKKGISSCQLARVLCVTQPTAWRMLEALRSCTFIENQYRLRGEIEGDEVYLGGRCSVRRGRKMTNKTTVIGFVERGPKGGSGRVVAKVAWNASLSAIKNFVRDFVDLDNVTTAYTDEWTAYKNVFGDKHSYCNHSLHRYVEHRGGKVVTTNRIENTWNHLEKIQTTYNSISRRWMQEYVDAWVFRCNTRGMTDWERLNRLLGNYAWRCDPSNYAKYAQC